jgi:NAD(P)H dehydrogenase (quinone)
MDHYEIAAAMARSLGITVRYEPISIGTFTEALTAKGLDAHKVQHLGSIAADYRNGVFAGTNNLVEVIGGAIPMTVESFARANRDAFGKDGIIAISAPADRPHSELSSPGQAFLPCRP